MNTGRDVSMTEEKKKKKKKKKQKNFHGDVGKIQELCRLHG